MKSICQRTVAALSVLIACAAISAAAANAAQPELASSHSVSFSGTGGFSKFRYETGAEIKCSRASISGSFFSRTEATAKMTFEECPQVAKAESEPLIGKLGYINKSRGEVGLLLEPASGNIFFPKFYPSGSKLTESLIANFGSLGTKASEHDFRLIASNATQVPLSFEGESFQHELKSVGGLEGGVAVEAFGAVLFSEEVELVGSEPTVETKTASSVNATGATLNGAVNPEASPTKYHFEYGTSTSYGSATAEASAGEGTTTTPESAGVTGLVAATTYHYRVVATGNGRTVYGGDISFTTGTPTLQLARGSGAFPVAYTVSGAAMKFVGKNGLEVQCKNATGAGSLTSVKEGTLSLTWRECKGLLGVACSSTHAGEIEAKPLKSFLAYTYPEKTTAEGRQTGLVLSPASGTVVAEFECGKVKSVLTGAVIAPITPLRSKTQTFTLTLNQSKGAQEVSFWETEGGEHPEAFLHVSTGGGKVEEGGLAQSLTDTLTGEEATIEL